MLSFYCFIYTKMLKKLKQMLKIQSKIISLVSLSTRKYGVLDIYFSDLAGFDIVLTEIYVHLHCKVILI
jgi:hypothetical protein